MCRSIIEGGRRCICDTSQARNHRRIAARVAARSNLLAPGEQAVDMRSASASVPAEPPAPVVTLADQVATARDIVRDSTRPAAEREQAVMRIGAAVTAEADRLAIAAGLDPDYQAVHDRMTAVKNQRAADLEALSAQINARYREAADLPVEERRQIREELAEWETQRAEAYLALRAADDALTAWRREQLAALAAGHRAALAQVRPMGGEFTNLTQDADKESVRILNDVLEQYPADWVRDANEHPSPVRVRHTKGRAHYVSSDVTETKKKVRVAYIHDYSRDDAPPSENDMRSEFVRVSDLTAKQRAALGWSDDGPGRSFSPQAWVEMRYEVFSSRSHRSRDGKPTGPGWEQYRYSDPGSYDADDDGYVTVWRRPRTKMATVARSKSSVLTVDRDGSPVGEHGAATAIHEFAHRMQHVRPELGILEEEHIRRRTTTDDGQRHPRERLYGPKSKELARPDGFANKYMGKEYESTTYHELMSCAMEGLYHGNHGGLVGLGNYKNDPESRAFALGVLATV